MSQILSFTTEKEFQRAPTQSRWPEITAEEFSRQNTDLHLVRLDQDTSSARCSLWWQNTPPYEGEKLGLIGHYAADSLEASNILLDRACDILKESGCTLAVGPIDGNIWNKYRFATWSNGSEPFLFDIQDPSEWLEYVTTYGFKPFLHYESRQVNNLENTIENSSRYFESFEKKGIVFRNVDLDRAEQELESIYNVSIQCFTERPLYTQQSKAAFIQQYRKILPHVEADFVTIVQDQEKVVGFMFVIPDILQQMRGENIDAAIIKTVAVLPDPRYMLIGTMLFDRAHKQAKNKGYKKVIHAFMHVDNSAVAISERYGSELIRRYALFSKPL